MINNVVLNGRLTKDPELKYTQSGIPTCRFTLAVNRNLKKEGQPQADFISIVVWRKSAENAANFLRKGSLCGIVGRIQTGSYEGQDGKRVYTTDIVAEQVQFLESGQQQQQPQQQNGNNSVRNQQQQQHYSNASYPPRNNYNQQPARNVPYNDNQNYVNNDDLPF